MRKKLRLDPERLAVDSFAAADEPASRRGTVRGAQLGQCTYWQSCDCWTAFYRCNEHMYTEYSCDYDTTGPRPTVGC